MKTSSNPNLNSIRPACRLLQKLVLPFACLVATAASAATEQWLGVPGTSVTTNWTDGANWTASVDQTYYNEVQFTNTGASANNNFSINNVLDDTSGVAQMPIWQLDFIPVNGNYTTLISPGKTLQIAAGNGTVYVGADSLNNGNPAAANAVETITLTGAGGTFSIAGGLYLGQGSTAPGDTHNVTLDLSGLDNFTDNSGNNVYVASGGLQRGNGIFYMAKTNQLSVSQIQIANPSAYSNSLPSGIYLGLANTITLGTGNLVVGGFGAQAGGFLKFNPAFIGGATVPSATFNSSQTGGQIATFKIANNSNGGGSGGTNFGVCDLSGGTVSMAINVLQAGISSTVAGSATTGTLTFDNGVINAASATLGLQGTSGGGIAVGVVNLNTNTSLHSSATLNVSGSLTLGSVTGTLAPGTAGTINLNGGNLSVGNIINGAGNGTVNLNQGLLTLTATAGTVTAPVNNFNTTNSTLHLTIASGVTNVYAANLSTGGTTNIISIDAAPPYASYPVQITLIKYSSLGGAGFNFGLGNLPALFAGHLVNNTANGSIDVVFTSGAGILSWNGNINANWDTTTANWLAGGAATYANGDVVHFFDGASSGTINLTATLSPSSLTVSNTALSYIFNGSGALAGATSLIKSGTGTLTLDNSGNNTFSGGVNLNNGTLQVGNNDANGSLPPGNIANNGSLIFAQSGSVTVGNPISGNGAVTQSGGGTLTLNGANSFAGNVVITNNSTLQNGGSAALGSGSGSVIVANGSTLDIAGNASPKNIIVSGSGVGGNGAITDTGGAVYGLVNTITLTGDTTFNYPNRWDLNNVLSTGGNAYNLTLNSSSGYFQWSNLAIDPALANITLVAGELGIVGTTTLGNPANTLTLSSGSKLTFYGSASSVNKLVDFQSGATINNNGGANTINGTMILESGVSTFNIGGTSLNLSNVLTGSGILYQNGGGSTLILSGNSPAYTGYVSLYTGTNVINGTLGGTGITSQSGTTVAGSGTVNGLADINGALIPGDVGIAGTFTAGSLTLESSATLTMDLSSSLASGNDLIHVTGDLTINGNNISINPIGGTLADGTYNLITYTGSFNGSIGTAATVYPTAYTLVLTNNTATKQIQVIVSGTLNPSLLIWNNANGSGQWDVGSSANWSNVTTHAASSAFNTLDSVVLNDSILTATTPITNIVIASTVVPSVITNNSTVNYTLSGSGTISGSGSLVKQGSGTLGLNVAGNFTGPVSILGGTIQTLGNNTLGSVASITVANGATFDFAGNPYNRTNPIIISGTGVNGVGAITNSGGTFYGTILNIVLANDAVVSENPNGRWDFAAGSSISGAHHLIVNAAGYGEIQSNSVAANVLGITITNGSIGLQHMENSCQNPATVFTVASNSTLTVWSGGFNGSLYLIPSSTLNIYSANSEPLTIVSGATLSGSPTIGGNDLVVGTGATISPSGVSSATIGTINVSGNVTLNGTTVIKLNGSGINDAIISSQSITYGGTLNLSNISATPLASGNLFQVFSGTNYSGSFASIVPATPGAGLAWDLSQLNTGYVGVVAAGGTGPVISSPQIIGGNLVFSGTGGPNNGSYHVLTTTNLTTALANWTVLSSGTFDGSGNFAVTNAIGTSQQQFYIIQQP